MSNAHVAEPLRSIVNAVAPTVLPIDVVADKKRFERALLLIAAADADDPGAFRRVQGIAYKALDGEDIKVEDEMLLRLQAMHNNVIAREAAEIAKQQQEIFG